MISKIVNGRRMLFLLFLFFALSLNAQNNLIKLNNLFDIRNVADAAIDPAAENVAYILNIPVHVNQGEGTSYNELHVYNIKAGTTTPILTGKISAGAPKWSSDGKRVYFVSNMGEGTQVYYTDINDKKPVKVTNAASGVLAFALFPDNKRIAYVSTVSRLPELKQQSAKGYKIEYYEEDYHDRVLHVMNTETGEVKALNSGNSVFEFDINPDGRTILAAVSPKNLIDYEYMFKRVYQIDVATGAQNLVFENPGKLSEIAWNTDGSEFSVISAANVNDNFSGSLFSAKRDNELSFDKVSAYSKGFEGSVFKAVWADKNTILYYSDEGVETTLRTVKSGNPKPEVVLEPGKIYITGFSYANGVAAIVASRPEHPAELYIYDVASKKLTKATENNGWVKNLTLGKQEKISYKAKDGLTIEGVLIYPVNYKAGTKYPLITYIHGGPEACEKNGWHTSYNKWGQFAAAKGFFYFAPNYRASSGRGVDFSHMGFGDLVGKEFEDVIDGIDHLIKLGYVDEKKVGIGGGSYGGYFSAWAATKHTNKFAASTVFVGVTNQLSKSNTTDIPEEDYLVHWGVRPLDAVEKYLERSPIMYTKNTKTPTLILHGKDDPRVPALQSIELYRTLKTYSDVPTRLVLYPGEGHGNRKNTNRFDFLVRTLQWYEWYLGDDSAKKSELPPLVVDYDEYLK
ncbi:MAG: S9 family peptidase [Ignavibacteriaceae bacterium]|nr:S9 family peptidase [Ignavibacteriaceae bacterium]